MTKDKSTVAKNNPGIKPVFTMEEADALRAQLEQDPEPKPAKKTPGRKARTASNGVVATEADGDDISNPDDSKS